MLAGLLEVGCASAMDDQREWFRVRELRCAGHHPSLIAVSYHHSTSRASFWEVRSACLANSQVRLAASSESTSAWSCPLPTVVGTNSSGKVALGVMVR